jgi:NAD(P)-dependent dehydrogenase (short-subunit alcohol dehydrogenase family)
MTISLQNQTVVVTGGAKRLGRAIVLECAAAGANVAVTFNHSEAEARELVEQLRIEYSKAQFACFEAELSQSEDVLRLTQEIVQTFGRVDALVNNAAIFRRTPFETMTENDFDNHIASNLKAPFLLCKSLGDVFLRQKSGAIVNIADIHGLRPLKNYIPYCVSKAGLISLTQGLAKALAPHVRVNCLCPGTILPPSQAQNAQAQSVEMPESKEEYSDDMAQLTARIPLARLGSPDEIAQTVVFLIGGPQFISGAILPVDGAEHLR